MTDKAQQEFEAALPKNDHAFADLEGDQPDILLWNKSSMLKLWQAAHDAQSSRIAALESELAECRKDALRYRYLVGLGRYCPDPFDQGFWGFGMGATYTKTDLDACLDPHIAAMQKEKSA